jgi:hypothetical protein
MTLIEIVILGVFNFLISMVCGAVVYFVSNREIELSLGTFIGMLCLLPVVFLVWVNWPRRK